MHPGCVRESHQQQSRKGKRVDKRHTKWSAASAPFEEVEGGGATSIVLKVMEEVDVGVLQPSRRC